jgi:hypothetical protein
MNMTTNTTKTAVKKPRFFALDEVSSKITSALSKLQETQKPGQSTGKVTKSEVLKAHEQAIKDLHAKGYSVKQIAAAISDSDVFDILPKTITQIVSNGTSKPRKTKPKAKATDANKAAENTVKAPANAPVKAAQKSVGGDVE